MQPVWPEDLTSNATILERLDVRVNAACMDYYRATHYPAQIISPEDGLPTQRYRDFLYGSLLELVLVCDARAKLEEREDVDETLEWVAVARTGFQRIGRETGKPEISSKATTRTFSDRQAGHQRAAYEFMREATGADELDIDPRTYATHVALGEICLAREPAETTA